MLLGPDASVCLQHGQMPFNCVRLPREQRKPCCRYFFTLLHTNPSCAHARIVLATQPKLLGPDSSVCLQHGQMPFNCVRLPRVKREPCCRYTVRVRPKPDVYTFSLFRSTIFEERSVDGVPENGCSELALVRWPSLALLAESIDKIPVLQTEATEGNITLLGRTPT